MARISKLEYHGGFRIPSGITRGLYPRISSPQLTFKESLHIYWLAGWEGSTNDGRIFNSTIHKGFIIPQGQYYLADAGFSNSRRLLVPYRGVRYYLQETARAGLRPRTQEELYNLRHSQVRYTVERAFGRLKGTFRIYRTKPCFGITTQVKVIYTIAALMNWLIEYSDIPNDDILVGLDEEDPSSSENNFTQEEIRRDREGNTASIRLRKEIAQKIQEDYIQYIAN